MAKKFVRGITDIKNIEHQDFDTNNVNDLLSDGQNNYIHRKKGNSEEYHNLTNNLKTLQSDDTDLLTVTNYNNTTNSATIRPKHDVQKEQVLESTDETILISHGENGTDETTTVDVNPEEVLKHDNLLTGYGISKTTSGNTTTLSAEYTAVSDEFDLNSLLDGYVKSDKFINAPLEDTYFFVTSCSDGEHVFQEAVSLFSGSNVKYVRCKLQDATWRAWREQVGDRWTIDNLLGQKQNKLTSNTSIAVVGTGLMQLYSYEMSYSNPLEGSLNTYAKTVQKDTSLTAEAKVEYHFTALLKDNIAGMTVDLEDDDVSYFTSILTKYGRTSGSGKDAMINGLLFTLNGSRLTVSRTGATYNQVVSFCDIIEPALSVQSSNQEQESE